MVFSKFSAGFLIFLISLIFFISITNGNFWESDSRAVYETTRNLVGSGKLNIDCVFGELSSDGQCYSKYGLFMSVSTAPFFLVDRITREYLGISYFFDGFFSSLTNSFISAMLVWLIFKFLVRMGFSDKLAIGGAFISAVCTYVPAYTKTLFSEPLETFLMLGSIYALLYFRNNFALAGYLFGFALLTKFAAISFIPCFLVYFLYRNITFRQLTSFSLPVLACVLVFFGYNYVRFDNILDTGYRNVKFDYPMLKGLALHFFSPGKSIFLYMPILILSFFGLKSFFKENRILFILMFLVFVITTIFYSVYMHPAGDWAWGSRYLYTAIPFFVFGLVYFLKKNRSILLMSLFIVFTIFSILIQLTSIYLGNHRYYAYLTHKYQTIPWERVYFDPLFSPLINQSKMILRIGYSPTEHLFWREAFQEYIDFSPRQTLSDPDLFFLRSKREFLVFVLLWAAELLLISKLLNMYRINIFSSLISFIRASKILGGI